jgi:hypothetical protein
MTAFSILVPPRRIRGWPSRLFRLLNEPRYLWRQYRYRIPRFVVLFTAQLIRQQLAGSR